jgi:glycerol-1-phosphatase
MISASILPLLDVSEIEGIIPERYGADAKEVPGARQLLEDLKRVSAPWAIVTSGTRQLVTGWLNVMKLAHPAHLVTAEDVTQGKPDPSCYALGRDKLGLAKNATVLVLEDAPAGVRSGKAAGFRVVGLATSHTVDQLREAGADWIVRDMRSVKFKGWEKELGAVVIEISGAVES